MHFWRKEPQIGLIIKLSLVGEEKVFQSEPRQKQAIVLVLKVDEE